MNPFRRLVRNRRAALATPAMRMLPALLELERRDVPSSPPPTIWVGSQLSAAENGPDAGGVQNGAFRILATDSDATVTVNYVIRPYTTDPLLATMNADAGADYSIPGMTGSVTLSGDGDYEDVVVVPAKDNVFEEDEFLILEIADPGTGPNAPYVIPYSGSTAAYVSISDDAPVVNGWFNNDATPTSYGTITVTRSQGNIAESLPAWVEIDGTTTDEFGTVPLVHGGLVTFPAGVTTLTLTCSAGPNVAINVAGIDEPVREDESTTLTELLNPGVVGIFGTVVGNLTSTITYQEYQVLERLRVGTVDATAQQYGLTQAQAAYVQTVAANKIRQSPLVDWRTLPQTSAQQALATVTGVAIACPFVVEGYDKVKPVVADLITKLGAAEFEARIGASQALTQMIQQALNRNDLGRASAILKDLQSATFDSDPEVKFRAEEVIRTITGGEFTSGYFRAYRHRKLSLGQ